MRLLECYVENFGTLCDFKHSFSSGLNVLRQDNGCGKTTLTVFIKVMLYGLESTKKTKLEENERKHYTPWNRGRFGGSLTFEVNGKHYRVERTFMSKGSEDEFKLYDCKSGKESFDYTNNLGEEIFGIDSDGFERTLFLSEMNLSVKNDNKSISAKLSDLVGTGGDLGVMDEAVELLEKQRKIYHKKGGTGEIGEIKSKISALDLQLGDIARAKEEYENLGLRIAEVNKALATLNDDKKMIEDTISKAEESKLKRTFEKQYLSMKEILEDDLEALKPLERFFACGIPSEEEISSARESYIESTRTQKSEAAANYGKEFEELSTFFENDAEEEEYENAKTILKQIDDRHAELRVIERTANESPRGVESDISEAEIDALLKNFSFEKDKKASSSRTALKILFAIAAVMGAVLGATVNPLFYLLCIAIIALFPFKRKNTVTESDIALAEKIFEAFDIEYSGSKIEIPHLLDRAKILVAENTSLLTTYSAIQKKTEALKFEIDELKQSLLSFVSRYPVDRAGDIYSCVSDIINKKRLYLMLKERVLNDKTASKEKSLIAKAHAEKARIFLSRYPTVSAKPFDEIAEKLFSYKTLLRTVEKSKSTLLRYASEHNISTESIKISDDSVPQFTRTDIDNLDIKISENERIKTLLTRQCLDLYEQIENEESLILERAELKEKQALYTKKLFTIQKTKDFLKEAKDMLTSKYLAKTRRAFDKYIKTICNESSEEFVMDTSFAIMKNERGSYKPSEAYSKGTKDAYSLAARLALIDSLYDNEKPFIILDDPFVNLDDGKFTSASKALRAIAKEKQIIYMTCSNSRVI